MTTRNHWAETAPQMIYEAYPDHDLLPIDPPAPGETIGEFKVRAEEAGDTLFLFLCREASDDTDAREYAARLDRAIRDIADVQEAFHDESTRAAASPTDLDTPKPDMITRLALGDDWIELALSYADAHGRRAGRITSSLRSSEAEADRSDAAVDAIESMVLAHACAGIDVTNQRYVEGIQTCVDACGNYLHEGEAGNAANGGDA